MLIGTDVFFCDSLCFFDGVAGVELFRFHVMFDAAFGFADGTGTVAGDAGTDLDGT